MKKLLLFALIHLCLLNGFAQNSKYIPFPSNMIAYAYLEYANSSGNQYYSTKRFEIQGDTLINGLHYSLWLTSTSTSNMVQKKMGGIRNDIAAKKVYAYLFDTNKEELLYDFDLHVGDTLFKERDFKFYRSLFSGEYWSHIDTVWVSRIDSVLMPHDGVYHKRFNFEAKFEYGPDKFHLISSESRSTFKDDFGNNLSIEMKPLVEGVGPDFDIVTFFSPFEGLYDFSIVCRSINGNTLNQFSNIGGNPLLFEKYCESITIGINETERSAALSIYPNPSEGKFKFVVNKPGFNFLEISNIVGDKILNSPILTNEQEVDLSGHAAGVYFIRVYNNAGESLFKRIITN